jgi:hypothetical protein
MADETLYAFNYSDSEALLAGIGKKRQGGQIASDAISDNATYIGVSTTAITARSGTTVGSGTAQLKYTDSSGVLQNLYSVAVNNAGSAIASGAYLKVFRVGNRFFAVELC